MSCDLSSALLHLLQRSKGPHVSCGWWPIMPDDRIPVAERYMIWVLSGYTICNTPLWPLLGQLERLDPINWLVIPSPKSDMLVSHICSHWRFIKICGNNEKWLFFFFFHCFHFYSILYIYPFKFADKCLGFRLKFVDEFTKFVPSAFIGHHQGLFACVKSVCVCFLFFI